MKSKVGATILASLILLLSGCGNTPKEFIPDGSIVDVILVSDVYTLYCLEADSGVPRYDLYNKETGESVNLPTMPEYVKLESIVNENCFIFHATGENSESTVKHFPSLLICYQANGETFQSIRKELYHDLTESVSAGSQDEAILEAISFSLDGIQCLFNRGCPEQGIIRNDIPPVSTSYNQETSQFSIHMTGCTLSPSLTILDDALQYGSNIIDYAVLSEADTIMIVLTLDVSSATKYFADSTISDKLFCTFRFLNSF